MEICHVEALVHWILTTKISTKYGGVFQNKENIHAENKKTMIRNNAFIFILKKINSPFCMHAQRISFCWYTLFSNYIFYWTHDFPLGILEFGLLQFGSSLGINYGQVANNLPSPTEVVSILCSLQVTKTRIYDTNPQVLTAFANSGIELIVTVPNDQVASMMNPSQSLQWISTNVKPYLPATRITGKHSFFCKN